MKNKKLKNIFNIVLVFCIAFTSVMCFPQEASAGSGDFYKWTKITSNSQLNTMLQKNKNLPVMIIYGNSYLNVKSSSGNFTYFYDVDMSSIREIQGFVSGADSFIASGGDQNMPQIRYINSGYAGANRHWLYFPQARRYMCFGYAQIKYTYSERVMCFTKDYDDYSDLSYFGLTTAADTATAFNYAKAECAYANYDRLLAEQEVIDLSFLGDASVKKRVNKVEFENTAVFECDYAGRWAIGSYTWFKRSGDTLKTYHTGNLTSPAFYEAEIYAGEPIQCDVMSGQMNFSGIINQNKFCQLTKTGSINVGRECTYVLSAEMLIDGTITIEGDMIVTSSGLGHYSNDHSGISTKYIRIKNGGNLTIMDGGLLNVSGNIVVEPGGSINLNGTLIVGAFAENYGLVTVGQSGVLHTNSSYPFSVAADTLKTDNYRKHPDGRARDNSNPGRGGIINLENGIIDLIPGGMLSRSNTNRSASGEFTSGSEMVITGKQENNKYFAYPSAAEANLNVLGTLQSSDSVKTDDDEIRAYEMITNSPRYVTMIVDTSQMFSN